MGHNKRYFLELIFKMHPQKLTHKLYNFYLFLDIMGESQSRYSIVERLTQKKLNIMTSKSNIKEDVREKGQEVEKFVRILENWKKDLQEDIKREERKKELEIERAKQEYENSKVQMKDKEEVLDKQIKAIEEALKSIEEISKTSTNIQS
jgi:valyl-tRNA synthetase